MSIREQLEVLVKAEGIGAVQAQMRELAESSKKAGAETVSLGDKFAAVGAKTSAFSSALKGAFTGASALAVVKFAKDSVQAYSESEAAQIRLQDAFNRFPGLADTNIAALQALNGELQRKTGIDDDALASAQELIAGFGLTGKQVQAITPLMADLSVKMGVDMNTAATTMGRALLGNGRELKKLGLDFKNTGTKSGNLKEIMDKLGPTVSGVAERMGDTAAGKTQRLAREFDDLQKLIGSKLLPIINAIMGTVLKLAQGFMDLPGPIQAMIGVVGAAVSIMLNWAKITTAVKSAQTALNLALKANPIALVVTLIAALITALVYAYQHSEKFRTVVNNAFRSIAPVVGTVVGYVVGYISTFVKAWTTGITTLLGVLSHIPKIGDTFAAARDKVASVSKGITDKLDEVAVKSKAMVVEYAKNLSDKVPAATAAGTDAAIAQATKFANNLGATGKIAGDKLASGIKSKSSKVKQAVKDVADEAKKQLDSFVSDVQGILGAVSAKADLAKAERELNALYAEQAGLGDAIAAAQLRINAAKTDGAKITAEEQVAIEDATSALDDARKAAADYAMLPVRIANAEKRLAAVQADAEASSSDLKDAESELVDLRKQQAAGAPYSAAKLQVLEDALAKAKSDAVAPTDDLKDAEQALAELRTREVEIQRDIADANQAVIDKTLAVAKAQQEAQTAQAELAKSGSTLLAYFTELATKAGLSADQIARVTAAMKAQSAAGAGVGAAAAALSPVARTDAALTAMANTLAQGGSASDALARGATVYANVTVEGSVIAENDLAKTIRDQLIAGQYYGQSVVIP